VAGCRDSDGGSHGAEFRIAFRAGLTRVRAKG
jgi:hypothetical protein